MTEPEHVTWDDYKRDMEKVKQEAWLDRERLRERVTEVERERDHWILEASTEGSHRLAAEADLAAMQAGRPEVYCPDCHHRQRDHKRIGATCCQEDWCRCQREFHAVSPGAAPTGDVLSSQVDRLARFIL